jgi:putative hydrolase of the HAD superfamily
MAPHDETPRAVFFDVGDTLLDTNVVSEPFAGDGLRVVPDAPASLARLAARGITLGVISNWGDSLEAVLERAGLRPYFAVVVGSGATGQGKPGRAIFERALKLAHVAAHEAWHVGDDPTGDAIGAHRAGLHALLLDPFDLYAKLDAHGIVRARSLTAAVDRILGGD